METHKFKKGQKVHLDHVYNILPFIDKFLIPFNTLNEKGDKWKENTEEFTLSRNVEIKITIKL